ncbi:replication protein P [Psychromonas sp. PT13]|uniref:replication protein P n=1 Tax=Psychromonas sp. PT13 TaxID=3439547 RepID=UPI003EC12D92
MKSMNQIAQSQSFRPAHMAGVVSLNEQAAYDINDIFKSLKAIFPTFKLTFPDDESLRIGKKVWVKTLLEGKITTHEQIRIGMKRARASGDFMPSAGKFVDWCRITASDMGLPSREDAFREAIGNLGVFITAKWSHPVVFETVKQSTCYALKNNTEKEARALFYRNYAIMVERVRRGEQLDVSIPKGITAEPTFRAASPEFEQTMLTNMKKMVGLV